MIGTPSFAAPPRAPTPQMPSSGAGPWLSQMDLAMLTLFSHAHFPSMPVPARWLFQKRCNYIRSFCDLCSMLIFLLPDYVALMRRRKLGILVLPTNCSTICRNQDMGSLRRVMKEISGFPRISFHTVVKSRMFRSTPIS